MLDQLTIGNNNGDASPRKGGFILPGDDLEAGCREAIGFATTYLTDRGIDISHSQLEKVVKVHTASATKEICGKYVPSIEFLYFDLATGEIDKGHRKLRFLKEVKRKVVVKGETKEKVARFWCTKSSEPRVYMPLPVLADPKRTLTDASQMLTSVEAEVAAILLSLNGIPSFAYGGGAWNFESRKNGRALALGFEHIKLFGRVVEDCPDHDITVNHGIMGAAGARMKGLTDAGAQVVEVKLPGPEKGPDDLIAARGIDFYKNHQEVRREDYKLAKPLWALREEMQIISDPAGMRIIKTGKIKPFGDVKATNLHRKVFLRNRAGELKEHDLIDEYMKWPYAVRYPGLSYEFNGPEELPGGFLNTATPCAKPKNTSVELWHQLQDHLFGPDRSDKDRVYFERWVASLLQTSDKPYTAIVFRSRVHGTGKSMTFELISGMFKDNGGQIKPKQLFGEFNEFIIGKRFLFADEIVTNRNDVRGQSNELRDVITRERLWINPKHVSGYYMPDQVGYCFSTNEPDGLFITDQDRRYAIFHVAEKKLDPALARELRAWKKSGEAASALAY